MLSSDASGVLEDFIEGCMMLGRFLKPYGFALTRPPYIDSVIAYARLEEDARATFGATGRSVDLWFRYRLADVVYRVEDAEISHRSLTKRLAGDGERPAYPPFSQDPLEGFRAVIADLERWGEPVLTGTATQVRGIGKA